METSCWGKPIVSTGFSPSFRAFEPGFPRSPPSAHGGSWTSYAFVAGIGKSECGQMRHHTGSTLLTNAVKPHCSLSSKAELLGQLSQLSRLGLHFEFGKEDPKMASKGLVGAGDRRDAADGASG